MRGRWSNDLQSRNVEEPRLGICRVIRPAMNVPTAWQSYDHRYGNIPSVVYLSRVCDNLIESARDKIGKLHFRNRPHPNHRGTGRSTNDGSFGQRRVDDTFLAEMLEESFRRFE